VRAIKIGSLSDGVSAPRSEAFSRSSVLWVSEVASCEGCMIKERLCMLMPDLGVWAEIVVSGESGV
jgi:hypothetical protein